MDRRKFLKLTAAGGAALTMAGCSEEPVEKLIPILVPPPHYNPSKSIIYATTCRECTAACGLFVKTREGRAVKIEGNPYHPFNQGKICALGQAALQGLYSPARMKGPIVRTNSEEKQISWKDGIDLLVSQLQAIVTDPQKQVLFIGQPETGTLGHLIRSSLKTWGGGDFLNLDLSPVHSFKKANELVFGEYTIPHYDLSKADTLINFGSDFLESWLNPIHMAGGFTELHAIQKGRKGRFIHVSPHLSLTGANADLWHRCEPGFEFYIALELANRLLPGSKLLEATEKARLKAMLTRMLESSDSRLNEVSQNCVENLVTEFKHGQCLCLAGGNATAGDNATLLHFAVNLINYLAGAVNKSVVFGADYQYGGETLQNTKNALQKLGDGKYAIVFICNTNPVYALPNLSDLESDLKKAPFVVSLSTESDETSSLAALHLPTSHYLESWGDSSPAVGIHSLQQPVMNPVPGHDTRQLGDLLLQINFLLNPSAFRFKNYRDYLAESWKQIHRENQTGSLFPLFWKSCLRQGGLFGKIPAKAVSLQKTVFTGELKYQPPVRKDFTLLAVNSSLQNGNGHTGNRYWLLETPHPISQVAWDNWVDIHPETADRLGIGDGDLVEITSPRGSIEAVARHFYGIDQNTLAVPMGYGRSVLFPEYPSRKSRNRLLPVLESKKTPELSASIIGSNVARLFPDTHEKVSGDFIFLVPGVNIKRLGSDAKTVRLDGQFRRDIMDKQAKDRGLLLDFSQKGRNLIRTVSADQLEQFSRESGSSGSDNKQGKPNKSGFYASIEENVAKHTQSTVKTPPAFFNPYKWEMVIDLDRCIGCSACVVACYAENNIAIVGKERVRQGREMSWLRIERFFEFNEQTGEPETYFSPQMCAQCDNAGCEPVCPVSATYKTSDGLNAMIYNRCVGSRYCSNNCIFKQRRFNWRTYQFPSPLHYQLNPDVSVREKGVMEKCTFCQQRIRERQIQAKSEGRLLKEAEVQTACQQTCPTRAITFGNVKEPGSKAESLKADRIRGYTQFEAMNFQPSITYLKKVVHNKRKA